MSSTLASLNLGAPGVYRLPDVPARALGGVRLDTCAFAGVAPRGPARVPLRDEEAGDRFWRGDMPCVESTRPSHRTVAVAVESFDDYRRVFGGFEGPGRLPYAVAAFFDNGGRRALVARVVHAYGDTHDDEGVASATLAGFAVPPVLRARSEGAWANTLVASLAFTAKPLPLQPVDASTLRVPDGTTLPAATLLRLQLPDGQRLLRFVAQVVTGPDPDLPQTQTLAQLASALPAVPVAVEVVEASLALDDGDGRTESFDGLGLAYGHPRWLAQVLCDASALAWPVEDWAYDRLDLADALLNAPPPAAFSGGADRYADIDHEDFFDDAVPLAEGEVGDGIACFAAPVDAGLLAVPDLYAPGPLAPLAPPPPVSVAGPVFAPCVELPLAPALGAAVLDLPGLQLDPVLDLDTIAALQQRVIDFAENTLAMVALLDVPPGLNPSRVRRWRSSFSSSYAAAYQPWLDVSRSDDDRDALVSVPPSAIAAGIIAAQELAFGVRQGPANVLALEVVRAQPLVPPALQGEWHQAGINVFSTDRDGIRLVGARTLSGDPQWRQLSVRRLMILLRRSLLAQMQWAPFEPNGPALWAELRQLILGLLRQLAREGAFRGATEAQSYYVRCDSELNPLDGLDNGRVVVEVGVAPAEPLEFIVLRLARSGDGSLTISE
jgi:hypothetical protein